MQAIKASFELDEVLTAEDIKACLSYASAVLHAEKVYPLKV